MSDTLLDFFNDRSELLKSIITSNSSSDKQITAKYTFIVSNYRQDDDNTIQINSLNELKNSVEKYFSNSKTNYEQQIKLSEILDESKNMYMHLQLP